MTNTNKLFNGRNDAIKFVDNYGSTILEAKRKATEEQLNQNQQMQKLKTKNLHLNCIKNLQKKLKMMKKI